MGFGAGKPFGASLPPQGLQPGFNPGRSLCAVELLLSVPSAPVPGTALVLVAFSARRHQIRSQRAPAEVPGPDMIQRERQWLALHVLGLAAVCAATPGVFD